MSIELQENDHVVCWIIGGCKRASVLGCLWRTGEQHKIAVRIRMHVDDKLWDSEDPKTWWRSEPVSEEDGMRTMHAFCQAIVDANGMMPIGLDNVDLVVVKADSGTAIEILKAISRPEDFSALQTDGQRN